MEEPRYKAYIAWDDSPNNLDVLFALDMKVFRTMIPRIHKAQQLVKDSQEDITIRIKVPGFFFTASDEETKVDPDKRVHESQAVMYIKPNRRPHIKASTFYCPIGLPLHQMFLR